MKWAVLEKREGSIYDTAQPSSSERDSTDSILTIREYGSDAFILYYYNAKVLPMKDLQMLAIIASIIKRATS